MVSLDMTSLTLLPPGSALEAEVDADLFSFFSASSHIFLICSSGEVFHVPSAGGFTYDEAVTSCQDQDATLAATGELYAAWKLGLNSCPPGWLEDRFVRYPISNATDDCGAGTLGVHTVYVHSNLTGSPGSHERFDAYCFRGKSLTVIT